MNSLPQVSHLNSLIPVWVLRWRSSFWAEPKATSHLTHRWSRWWIFLLWVFLDADEWKVMSQNWHSYTVSVDLDFDCWLVLLLLSEWWIIRCWCRLREEWKFCLHGSHENFLMGDCDPGADNRGEVAGFLEDSLSTVGPGILSFVFDERTLSNCRRRRFRSKSHVGTISGAELSMASSKSSGKTKTDVISHSRMSQCSQLLLIWSQIIIVLFYFVS